VQLKNRVHATLIAFGTPCPVSDLFGERGRRLLDRLRLPDPWCSDVLATVALIDELDRQIDGCERELRRLGADHRYPPLLITAPGIAWVLGSTIAAEIDDIERFGSPKKLAGYTGLCPRVDQSGGRDHRGSLAKNGPKFLRWGLIEAATHAARPAFTATTTSAPPSAWAASAARRSPASRSPASSAKRSGTCSTVTSVVGDEGLSFAVPTMSLVVLVVVATIAGNLAAILPARRASRLDPLTALAYE
jgi:transposase IS116/IS110/IS902 family protein